KLKNLYRDNGVNIIDRIDNKNKGDNVSAKLRYEVKNAKYLSNLIFDSISDYLDEDTLIAFEGLSYGSSGDVVLQLGGYKYILMDTLSSLVPLENMYTYSPITIKKTAGCSERGKSKKDVIDAFIKFHSKTKFKDALNNKREDFMKKGNKNWIDHVDDLVDSFWTLETLRDKEYN
ncbi:MAG: hypothetical protein ACOC1K_03805, partial [Nanoarchaeota archaeon]